MRASPLTDLAPLSRGAGHLRRHPLQALGLALLTVLLSALAPVLQIRAGLPDDPVVGMLLMLVALVPLELYFLPRFLLAVDAESLDDPRNPRDAWRATFETRWLGASLAKALLYLSVAAGAVFWLVPGLILLVVFGWTPWRVLLRGESLGAAARNSAGLMLRWGFRLLPAFSVLLTAQFLALVGANWLETRFVPAALAPWDRLAHPVLWAIAFGGGIMNIWISATSLAIYQHLEGLGQPKARAG